MSCSIPKNEELKKLESFLDNQCEHLDGSEFFKKLEEIYSEFDDLVTDYKDRIEELEDKLGESE